MGRRLRQKLQLADRRVGVVVGDQKSRRRRRGLFEVHVHAIRGRARRRVIGVPQNGVDVLHFAQLLEEGDQVAQLRVGHVVEPRGHGHLINSVDSQ